MLYCSRVVYFAVTGLENVLMVSLQNILTNGPKVGWPIMVIILTIVVITVIKYFGNFETKTEEIGAELNLLTYGLAVDLVVLCFQGQDVLPNWPRSIIPIPTWLVVVLLLIINLIFFMINLGLGKFIAENYQEEFKVWRVRALKGVSVSLGTISAFLFVFAEGFWS